MKMSLQEQEFLHAKLNMETAQMPWRELQRYFASGHILAICDGLDMVSVAVMMAADDMENISRLVAQKQIEKVTDEQAQAWFEEDVELWTVVIKPWILVQTRKNPVPDGTLLN
ncbi:DUF2288 domain-containing protein [Oxalobacter vibrioformis]|uniref:DUF2288 domain-containing protein n=1 Tax=Oxalobacter vibrioformis TaxID=933080 RepID=A0A9E9LTZ8_9BURK|nr:DUF2288 domain-containing protein [Oxalobacter vibrioformis]WAW09126.1 DUF2288 domain-containing protein [Oxalobacter vibrioformis]